MKSLTAITGLLGAASAHTIMQAVGGHSQGAGIYMPSDDSPQMNVGSNSMACNGSPIGGFRNPGQKITMQAGQSYTGAWLHTLTSTGPDSTADNKVIDSSHKGPVMAYMKKVSDSLSGNPSSGPGGGWFKISEDGYDGSKWGVDRLISAGGVQRFTIPSCIANGDYLVRLEVLALHSAYNTGGAQFYMECISVTVTGGTGTESPSTVSIPGAYSASDPGIKLMIYNNQGQPYPTTSYTPPGPRPFTCSGNPGTGGGNTGGGDTGGGNTGGGNTGGGNTGGGGSGSQAPHYGQCGGSGWTGPTSCESGYSCKASNEWYSQCL